MLRQASLKRASPTRPLPSSRVVASSRSFSSTSALGKQRLVILGSGWGGYELLRKVDKNRYDVTVVSPSSHFAFTPLLAGCAVGTLEYDCAIEPVRAYNNITYYQAWCDQIDLQRQRLTCMSAVGKPRSAGETDGSATEEGHNLPGNDKAFELGWDKLVIAVGAYSQTFNTPGVKEHAFFLKEAKDARKIRSRILECFELAAQPTLTDVERENLLHFAIVGGGPTGVEFAGELHDFITSDLQRAFPRLSQLARITIYDVAPKILGSFEQSLSRYAEDKFRREGITVKGSHHIDEVHQDHLVIKEEGKVPYGMLVWSTGLAPNPLIEAITDLEKDEKTHSLRVTDKLNPTDSTGRTRDNIFVLGDASMLEAKLPATAQVASQEALWLAKHLNKQAKGRDEGLEEGFKFNNRGAMAYLGGWKAVVDRSQADHGPKGELSGRASWILWRSAYFAQAMSVRNKMLIAFYWTCSWLFGRRITKI
ncbi:hypothetical protein JCM10212_006333 [Sporobolomyces blumeae]